MLIMIDKRVGGQSEGPEGGMKSGGGYVRYRISLASAVAARWALLAAMVFLVSGCVGPIKSFEPDRETAKAVSIYLVGQGWHTDLVVPRRAIPSGLWPEQADFPDVDYLGIGWGDWDYYQSPRVGLWMTLKAAFGPTTSVLLVSGLKGPVSRYYPHSEIIELRLSEEAFASLCHFIHDSFKRRGARAWPVGAGAGDFVAGRFYPAEGRFHLLRTCNVWTASALRAAGYPVGPVSALFSSTLIASVRKFAEPVR